MSQRWWCENFHALLSPLILQKGKLASLINLKCFSGHSPVQLRHSMLHDLSYSHRQEIIFCTSVCTLYTGLLLWRAIEWVSNCLLNTYYVIWGNLIPLMQTTFHYSDHLHWSLSRFDMRQRCRERVRCWFHTGLTCIYSLVRTWRADTYSVVMVGSHPPKKNSLPSFDR